MSEVPFYRTPLSSPLRFDKKLRTLLA